MLYEKEPVTLRYDYDFMKPSFEAVLDSTCERLWERHVQYSIRRIREMEEELNRLENALDEFIFATYSAAQEGNLGPRQGLPP